MKASKELDVRRITYSLFQSPKNAKSKHGTIVAITSPVQGEGVTYVSRLLCRELSGDQLGRTLYCTVEQVANAHLELEGEDASILTDAHFWTLPSSDSAVAQSAWEFNASVRQARMEAMRRRFDYVILDCPAVNESGEVGAIAPWIDAMLLVVAAGCSTRRQIAYAQQLLAECGAPLKGCVLNRRTYPIPSPLYRLLKGGSR